MKICLIISVLSEICVLFYNQEPMEKKEKYIVPQHKTFFGSGQWNMPITAWTCLYVCESSGMRLYEKTYMWIQICITVQILIHL